MLTNYIKDTHKIAAIIKDAGSVISKAENVAWFGTECNAHRVLSEVFDGKNDVHRFQLCPEEIYNNSLPKFDLIIVSTKTALQLSESIRFGLTKNECSNRIIEMEKLAGIPETADLAFGMIAKSLQLLNENGTLIIITPKSWLSARGHIAELKSWMLESQSLDAIDYIHRRHFTQYDEDSVAFELMPVSERIDNYGVATPNFEGYTIWNKIDKIHKACGKSVNFSKLIPKSYTHK